MRGVFDDREPEPAQSGRDTELTLSPGWLLAIFFGLVVICGLCFGLGYATGRRGSPFPTEAGLQAAPGAQASPQAESSRPKPSATAQIGAVHAPQSTIVNLPSSSGSSSNQTASAQNPALPAGGGSSEGQPPVRPALPSGPNQQQALQPAAVQPALPAAVPLMVQIAAVSHPEDAEVLVNALRKRGYAVVSRREATDNLIHVRIGPFNSRDQANQWRQKLLNDGYNAIVQP